MSILSLLLLEIKKYFFLIGSKTPEVLANNDRGQKCGAAVRNACIWIAQQFFGKILRELARDVWNLLRPCCTEIITSVLEDV